MCFTRMFRKKNVVLIFVLTLAAVVINQGGLRLGAIHMGPAPVLAADEEKAGDETAKDQGPTAEEAEILVLEGLEEKRQQLLKQEERLAEERALLEKLKKQLEENRRASDHPQPD